jgi:hypothetical protein
MGGIIKNLVRLLAADLGKARIRNINERGYRSRSGSLFGTGTIHRLLTWRAYTGVRNFNEFARKADGERRGRSPWFVNLFRNGARGRDRTTDTAIFSRMLYQLSYPGAVRIRSGSAGL